MTGDSAAFRLSRPLGVTVTALVNGVAAVLHLVFWSLAFLRLRSLEREGSLDLGALRTTYGFGIADLVWSVPMLALGAVGLWRLRSMVPVLARGANS